MPGVHRYTQKDGSVVDYLIHGDEFFSYMTDRDGSLLAAGADGDLYLAEWAGEAAFSAQSKASSSGVRQGIEFAVPTNARPASSFSRSAPDLSSMQPLKKKIPAYILDYAYRARAERDAALEEGLRKPADGTKDTSRMDAPGMPRQGKVLIVYVRFADETNLSALSSKVPTAATLSSLMFDANRFGSVAHYYKTVTGDGANIVPAGESQGTSNDGIVFVTLPGSHQNWRDGDIRDAVVKPALIAADPFVNFAAFDTNNDGIITTDELSIGMIVHGYESSSGANSLSYPSIWGHAWSFASSPLILDGKRVAYYFAQGAFHGTSNPNLLAMGILAHELGHSAFGFKDLYDYGYYDSEAAGLGYWSLMAGGSWGNKAGEVAGSTPTAIDAYNMLKSGLVAPVYTKTPADSGPLSLMDVFQVAKLTNPTKEKQYFLLQPRGNAGYDRGLRSGWGGHPGSGLMVYHVDEDMLTQGKYPSRPNDWNLHPLCDIEEAHGGVQHLQQSSGYDYGKPDDLFGDTRASLSDVTDPDSNLYDDPDEETQNTPSGILLSSISSSATDLGQDTGSVTVEFYLGTEAFDTDARIRTFTVAGRSGTIVHGNDGDTGTIAVTLPRGTDLTNLAPVIVLMNTDATVAPASGVAQDFSGGPVTYTVTATDGSTTKAYSVTAATEKSGGAEITGVSMTVGGTTYSSAAGNVALSGTTWTVGPVPYGTDVTALTPTLFLSDYATVAPASGVAQDFTSPVTYTVTAEDGTTQGWTLAVPVTPADTGNDMTNLYVMVGSARYNGTLSGTTWTVTVPHGTPLTGLAPVFTIPTKATCTPPSGTVLDFGTPQAYTVKAQSGAEKTYTVAISTAAPRSGKAMTNVKAVIEGTPYTGTSSGQTWTLGPVPFRTSTAGIAPTFDVSGGAQCVPASGTALDFANPQEYTVTAEDGTSQKYTIQVTKAAAATTKEITKFVIQGVSGAISESARTIAFADAPSAWNTASLTPVVTHTGISCSPTGAQNFAGPVKYTVTAEDGSTREYTATVAQTAQGADASMSNLQVHTDSKAYPGVLKGSVWDVTLPAGTKVSGLKVTFDLATGASATPPSGSLMDFSGGSASCTVTAQDARTTRSYTVRVTVQTAPVADRDTSMTNLAVWLSGKEYRGVLSGSAWTVNLPHGTDVSKLSPVFDLAAGAVCVPPSGTERNLGAAVSYTVTARDGVTKRDYTLTANVFSEPGKDPLTSKSITSFVLAGEAGAIDETAGTIGVRVPAGTDVTHIEPVVLHTGESYAPQGAQNFSQGPVTYTVAAQDGTTKSYRVTVTVPSASGDTTMADLKIVIGDRTYPGFLQADGATWLVPGLPAGTNLTRLTPVFALPAGARSVPASGTPHDFSSPVTYTVTAGDGTTRKQYFVKVETERETEEGAWFTPSLFEMIAGISGRAGYWNVSIRIPFIRSIDPSNISGITVDAGGLTGIGVSIIRRDTGGTVRTFADPQASSNYDLLIRGNAADRNAVYLYSVTVEEYSRAPVRQTFNGRTGIALSGIPTRPAQEAPGVENPGGGDGDRESSGGSSGCDAGTGLAAAILPGLFGLKRKNARGR